MYHLYGVKTKEEEIFLINLGAKIKALREERGISQEKLALEIELSKNQVGRIERGGNSTAGTLFKIAKYFGVEVAVLFN